MLKGGGGVAFSLVMVCLSVLGRYVFSTLRRLMSSDTVDKVRRMSLTADSHGAVFDVPSDLAQHFLDGEWLVVTLPRVTSAGTWGTPLGRRTNSCSTSWAVRAPALEQKRREGYTRRGTCGVSLPQVHQGVAHRERAPKGFGSPWLCDTPGRSAQWLWPWE